ncbi:hypothetical protein O7543_02550 [Solwaraspora sp. WMMA2080]|uniref:hypothetical protein n=1 Tax=Solwaraspora sp. WMMA2080 TaxID=3015165 RepID=UPI00248D1E9E|nr:hypothetical protein [Solwaraspora sp. WMMA2080]WBC21390.1 hypothetical protein O7543_02550 [Solwaraspora sp. WMMA2080]
MKFVAAQVGAAGLAIRWLRGRIATTARWWSVVAAVNRHALGVYLWHQPVLIGLTVTALGWPVGPPSPGCTPRRSIPGGWSTGPSICRFSPSH